MNAVAPSHANLALQAVSGESPFCPGMAFAVAQLMVFRKNCLDTQKSVAYKAAHTASYEAIRFTDGAPSFEVGRSHQEHRGDTHPSS